MLDKTARNISNVTNIVYCAFGLAYLAYLADVMIGDWLAERKQRKAEATQK